ncbi:trypsin-like serine protease [Nocardia sp. NPDC004654]|uniref:trypsin-like serine protease n=1 Tax=Nocardia sp. NPDC004654 TaxID=3154776 RepID=UPI0033B106EC
MNLETTISAALCALGLAILPAVPAQADDPVVVGPGTSIGVCTIASVGTDKHGNLVALTAGHCMRVPNQRVSVGGRDVGYFAAWSSKWPSELFREDAQLDYAVIQLDPKVVKPTNLTPAGRRVDRITPYPDPSQLLCKYGQVTEHTCGNMLERDGNAVRSWQLVFPGDSGGPAYAGSGLVGIASSINLMRIWAPIQFTGISGVLADLAAQGGVGAGFKPIG